MLWESCREPPVSVLKQREKLCAKALIEVSTSKRTGKAGLGLASLNNFIRLWGRGAILVVWYPVLGWLGQMCGGLVCESPIRELVENLDSGLVWFVFEKCAPWCRTLPKVWEGWWGKQETKATWLRHIIGLSRMRCFWCMCAGQMLKHQVYRSEKHGQYTCLPIQETMMYIPERVSKILTALHT